MYPPRCGCAARIRMGGADHGGATVKAIGIHIRNNMRRDELRPCSTGLSLRQSKIVDKC